MAKISLSQLEKFSLEKSSIYFSSHEKKILNLSMLSLVYLKRISSSLTMRLKEPPKVIVCSSHLSYDVIPGLFLARKYSSKMVVYVHLIKSHFSRNRRGFWGYLSLIDEKISLRACKNADIVFAVNERAKDFLVRSGFDLNKITVVGNGLDHDMIRSIESGAKEYDACFCGRISKSKGIYDLVEIWEKIVRNLPHLKLIVIGNGPEFSNLHKLVINRGLQKNIILAGFLSEVDKITFMKSSCLFIYPSYEDSWGIVVTEAMACGLPILCYDLPDFKLFEDAVLRASIGNMEEMTKNVFLILSDSNMRNKMSTRAIEFSKKFDWNKIALMQMDEMLKSLYEG